MIKWLSEHKHIYWVTFFPLYIAFFFIAEKIIPDGAEVWNTCIAIDYKIPFIPQFVVFYDLWYPFLAAIGFWLLFKDGNGFKKYVIFLLVTFTLSVLFCIIVPNGVDLRQPILTNDIFSKAVLLLRSSDTATNVFPSMHVIGSMGVVFAVFDTNTIKHKKTILTISIIIAVCISVSTLFIKQHSLLDVVAGIAAGLIAWIFLYLLPSLKETKVNKKRQRLIKN